MIVNAVLITYVPLSPVCTGVLAGPLIPLFGCRKVAILGVMLATSGNLVSSFTSHPVEFLLSFGIIGGQYEH